MDRSFVEKICENSAPNYYQRSGYTYSDKHLEIIKNPSVETIVLSTLSGLVDMIRAEHTKFPSPLVVQIKSPIQVFVWSAIGDADRERENPFMAVAELPKITFDQPISYESMMISLKSKFVETEETASLIKMLGTITEENNTTAADDGFSQSVTVKKGVALKENKIVNPIVRLRPYRTFIEVEQPESEFLIRLSDGMRVALYEADGGAWKLLAMNTIFSALTVMLDDMINDGKIVLIS